MIGQIAWSHAAYWLIETLPLSSPAQTNIRKERSVFRMQNRGVEGLANLVGAQELVILSHCLICSPCRGILGGYMGDPWVKG